MWNPRIWDLGNLDLDVYREFYRKIGITEETLTVLSVDWDTHFKYFSGKLTQSWDAAELSKSSVDSYHGEFSSFRFWEYDWPKCYNIFVLRQQARGRTNDSMFAYSIRYHKPKKLSKIINVRLLNYQLLLSGKNSWQLVISLLHDLLRSPWLLVLIIELKLSIWGTFWRINSVLVTKQSLQRNNSCRKMWCEQSVW